MERDKGVAETAYSVKGYCYTEFASIGGVTLKGRLCKSPLGTNLLLLKPPWSEALASTRNRVSEIETSRLSDGSGMEECVCEGGGHRILDHRTLQA